MKKSLILCLISFTLIGCGGNVARQKEVTVNECKEVFDAYKNYYIDAVDNEGYGLPLVTTKLESIFNLHYYDDEVEMNCITDASYIVEYNHEKRFVHIYNTYHILDEEEDYYHTIEEFLIEQANDKVLYLDVENQTKVVLDIDDGFLGTFSNFDQLVQDAFSNLDYVDTIVNGDEFYFDLIEDYFEEGDKITTYYGSDNSKSFEIEETVDMKVGGKQTKKCDVRDYIVKSFSYDYSNDDETYVAHNAYTYSNKVTTKVPDYSNYSEATD